MNHLRSELRYQRGVSCGRGIAVAELTGHGAFRNRRSGSDTGIDKASYRVVTTGAGLVAVARQVFVEEELFADRAHAGAGTAVVITPATAATTVREQQGGNKELRAALYQGALSVIYKLPSELRTLKEAWLIELVKRAGVKRTCIALANKTVRTAWALLATGKSYEPVLLGRS